MKQFKVTFFNLKSKIISILINSCRYPGLAEAAYGSERKGCFEPPHPENPPKSDLICEDLTPIEFASTPPNDLAMNETSQLVCTTLLHVESFKGELSFNRIQYFIFLTFGTAMEILHLEQLWKY